MGDEGDNDPLKTFGPWYRTEREKLGVSRADVDGMLKETHDLSTGYTALLESGRIKPPDRKVCATLAAAIKSDPGAVWKVAAEERLKRADPEVAAWVEERHRAELERLRQYFEKLLSDTESLIADSGLRADSLAQTVRTIKSIQDRSDRNEAILRKLGSGLRSSTSDIANVLNRYLHLVVAAAQDDFEDWLSEHPNATEQERQSISDRLVCELVHKLHVIPVDLPRALGAHIQRAHAYSNDGLQKAWFKERAEQMGREEELIDELRSVQYGADYHLGDIGEPQPPAELEPEPTPMKPSKRKRKAKEAPNAAE